MNVEIQIPPKLEPLFEPHRYKVLYGGRGGAKSWGAARALLALGASKPLRVLCCREIQNSIKDSVHKLLSDQVTLLGLERFYEVQSTAIKGRNGTEFMFEGLRRNATKIKSYEGVNIAWVEEAENITKTSWEILIPTIRKEDSEIWVTLNPQLEEDYTYENFVVNPPSSAFTVEVNWRDNPWFPKVLHDEMIELQRKDPDAWANIWEGKCRLMLDGAIYANEMRAALTEDRIGRVPYVDGYPVHTGWDLGHSDNTSIWFIQRIGFEYRVIDHYTNSGEKLAHYQQVLQRKGYIYGRDYLPHDAESKHMQDSVAEIMRRSGRTVVVVPRTSSIVNDINAVRTMLPSMSFDREKCADGLRSLRRYSYAVDVDTGRRSRDPQHDEFSHDADAFRTFVVGFKPEAVRKIQPSGHIGNISTTSPSQQWLGN